MWISPYCFQAGHPCWPNPCWMQCLQCSAAPTEPTAMHLHAQSCRHHTTGIPHESGSSTPPPEDGRTLKAAGHGVVALASATRLLPVRRPAATMCLTMGARASAQPHCWAGNHAPEAWRWGWRGSTQFSRGPSAAPPRHSSTQATKGAILWRACRILPSC
jgi:hypothetical protein